MMVELQMAERSEVSSPPRSGIVHQMEVEWNPEPEEDEGPVRASWGGKLEFLLTCVGMAVGLGNVWRFPYLCYKNGGGAFLIPYVLMLALVGVPMFFMEVAFGQFASKGPIAIWSINPLFKGLGYTMILANTMVALYYNVIIAWCMHYFFSSMAATLPWAGCDNPWNTPACQLQGISNSTMFNLTLSGMGSNNTINASLIKTPSEEYFYNKVLNISGGISEVGEVQWALAACLGAAWLLVFLVLIKGISSLGKVVYFSSLFPYVLLTAMLVRGVTLPGAIDGIMFYITPDFDKLMDAQVWSDAAVQIFYSLSTCTGGLVAMASYNPFRNNCLRDALLVPVINCATSLYAGFVIFSVLGFMAAQKGVAVADVAASGPGLVFVVYPEGLSQMPLAPIWAVMFFFMMLNLGFSSEFSMVETFFAAFMDELSHVLRTPRRVLMFRAACCLLFFVVGLAMCTRGGFYLFYLADNYVGGFPLLVVGLLEAVALQYIYGFSKFGDDIELMLGRRPSLYFKVTWVFVTPVILMAIIIFKSVQYERLTLFTDYVYPDWSMALAWLMVIGPMAFIPLMFSWRLLRNGGYELIAALLQPTSRWGPALKEDRTGRYATKPRSTALDCTLAAAYHVAGDLGNGGPGNDDKGIDNWACHKEDS